MSAVLARQGVRRADDVFFTSLSLLMLLIVLAGFAPSYFLRGAMFAHMPTVLVHLHGAVFSAWIVLFAVQSSLVAVGNVRLHRKLGWLGAILAAAMVVLGVLAPSGALRRGAFIPPIFTPASFLIDNVIGILIFGAFVAVAVGKRNNVKVHKRLLFIANVILLPPALSRIPVVQHHGFLIPAILLGLLLALIVFDLITHRRVLLVTVIGCVIFIGSQPVMDAVVRSAFGLSATAWAQGHP